MRRCTWISRGRIIRRRERRDQYPNGEGIPSRLRARTIRSPRLTSTPFDPSLSAIAIIPPSRHFIRALPSLLDSLYTQRFHDDNAQEDGAVLRSDNHQRCTQGGDWRRSGGRAYARDQDGYCPSAPYTSMPTLHQVPARTRSRTRATHHGPNALRQ
jgi:hypothetical protein